MKERVREDGDEDWMRKKIKAGASEGRERFR